MSEKLICLIAFVLVVSVWSSASAELVAQWKLDEGGGTTAVDATGNGNVGTLEGNPTVVDGQFGHFGLALAFEDSRVVIPASASLTGDLFQGSFTLTAWINPRRTGNTWQQIFRSDAANYNNDTLFINNDGRLSWRGTVGGAWAGGMCETAADAVPADQWTHVAVTGDGTNFRIYVNGELSQESVFHMTDGSNQTYYIGGTSGTESYSGIVDDLRVYNHALTEDDIRPSMERQGGAIFRAYGPDPKNGAMLQATSVNLVWRAGDLAVSHDVYLGDNFDDVNDAVPGDPTFQCNQTTTMLVVGVFGFAYPDGLVPGTTHYWRIDEVNPDDANSPRKGSVWRFSLRSGVSYVATDGSDVNPGTRELPWRTIAHAGQMVYPGETVILMDGVYRVEGQLKFGPAGLSADEMTTYKAAPGARVIFSGRDDIPPVVGMPDYVRLEGLWFGGTWMPEGTKNSSIQVGGSPIGRGKQMVNCTIFGYNDGILIGTTEHLLVYGNRLIHTGAGGYQHGIYLSGGSSTSYCSNHVIVDNNIFLDGEGYAIHGWHGPRSMIVTRNFISGHHHGIVMAGSDHLIANNFVWSSKAENPYSILFSGRNIVAVNNMLRQGSPAAAFNSNRLESNAFLETYSAGLSPIILSSGNEQSEFGISAKEIDDIVAELSNIFYQPVETIHADQRIEPLFAKLRMTIPNGSQLKDAGQAWYEPGKSVNIGPDADQPACVGTLWYAFREWGLQDWDRERTVYEPDLSGVSEGRAPDIRDNDLDGSSNDSDPDDDNDGIPDAQDSDRDGDMVDDSDEIILAKDPDSQLSTPRGEPVLEVSHEVIALDSIFGLNPPGMTLRLRNRGVGGLAWGAAAENSWVELSSTSGLLNTAEKKYLELIFATEALPAGKHTTNIVFTYEQNTLILPVLVTVYRQSRLGQELLHHFTFDEGQGSTARDRIRGRNGIVHGGSWVQGQIGSALHFDGVDDYVEIPDSITDFSQFTVVLWFKTRSRGQAGYGAAGFSDNTMWQCYLAAAGDAAEISLATINGRLRATFNLWQNGDARNLYSGVEANDDQWHQAALTISAEEQICLYLDGILVASRAIREDASVINQKTPGEQQIAYTRWWRDPPKYYSGAIDDVRFYGRALSPAEIDVLFLMATAPDDWGLPGSGSSSGEDFESGDMSGSDWTTYGDSDWYITSSESYSGTYSIRAGSIGDNESSTLAIEHECSAGDITFYLKVSSESGWDKLVFYIDRVKQHEWSGERSWDQVSFPVESGTRTFEWVYTKDESSDDGSDTAWLDDISFP